jgi:hypothetical protein
MPHLERENTFTSIRNLVQEDIHLIMKRLFILIMLLTLLTAGMRSAEPLGQQPDPTPPSSPVKLIFIHHSTGGNWLADSSNNELGGNLGQALMNNNYYVSATNYGWGPDSIGDATDIPNWLDWFRSERSPAYLEALYKENGQNFGDFGAWQRLPNDPGGENQIILFKSCFPNSDLEGNPNDLPTPMGWLSVSNAKYVYNEILQYFATRPDKLFVIITAPPLINSAYSNNARAFNLWLVNDWLHENGYTLNNVAVFDLYNVLTGPDHHHRIINNQVEHTYTIGRNLLHYPSSDDHPSRAGNEKATQEFIPMLNAFYNRWKATAPDRPPAVELLEPTASSDKKNIEDVTLMMTSVASSKFIEDFENGAFAWEAFFDEDGATHLTCAVVSEQPEGTHSLQIEFNVAKDGWATCARFFDNPQNWSTSSGLSFALRSDIPGVTSHVDIYVGQQDKRETYYYTFETLDKSNIWIPVSIPWEDFHRVEWEENAGTPFSKADRVAGIAFGFPSDGDHPGNGMLWVDNVRLLDSTSASVSQPELRPTTDQQVELSKTQQESQTEEETPFKKSGNPLCGGGLALPLILIGWGFWLKKFL